MNQLKSLFEQNVNGVSCDSLIIEQNGKIIYEKYKKPFGAAVLHRMFSIAKSYTSLAVGALYAEGKLNLNDRITEYFPEYRNLALSEELLSTTIRNLLMMRTPYAKTTYKIHKTDDWVKSFFEVPADHKPGMCFQYDTSAALVLGALVKRVSGKGVLDYLREVFLHEIGFSKDAYLLRTPSGDEDTGSGLMALPRDLLFTGEFLLAVLCGDFSDRYPDLIKENRFDVSFWGKYSQYIKKAMQYQSATVHTGKTRSERCGYGYQFWMLPKGGVMMYGMGGQYLLLYPEKKSIIVTSSDTQSEAGGTQRILDAAEEYVFTGEADDISLGGHAHKSDRKPPYGRFRITKENTPFLSYTFSPEELILEGREQIYHLPCSEDGYSPVTEWNKGLLLCARGEQMRDGSYYIHARLVGERLGAVHIMLCEENGRALLYLRCVEEVALPEFNGFYDSEREE